MKKLILMLVCCMVGLSAFRMLIGNSNPELSLTKFLSTLSTIDIDFEHTINSIVTLRSQLSMPNLPSVSGFLDIFAYVAGFVDYIFALIGGVVGALISLVIDILDFLYSIVTLFNRLIYS